MCSSERCRPRRYRRLRPALAGACVALLAGCALPAAPGGTLPAAPASVACAAGPGAAARPEAQALLRGSVERGPLYALAAAARLVSCEVRFDPDPGAGAVSAEYRFGDGAVLRARRDRAIEYSEQQLDLARPLAADPLDVLQAAERAAFGPKGCGIDWRHAEPAPSPRLPAGSERVYRGTVCNCQARVRSDAAGGVRGLLLRSAC